MAVFRAIEQSHAVIGAMFGSDHFYDIVTKGQKDDVLKREATDEIEKSKSDQIMTNFWSHLWRYEKLLILVATHALIMLAIFAFLDMVTTITRMALGYKIRSTVVKMQDQRRRY